MCALRRISSPMSMPRIMDRMTGARLAILVASEMPIRQDEKPNTVGNAVRTRSGRAGPSAAPAMPPAATANVFAKTPTGNTKNPPIVAYYNSIARTWRQRKWEISQIYDIIKKRIL